MKAIDWFRPKADAEELGTRADQERSRPLASAANHQAEPVASGGRAKPVAKPVEKRLLTPPRDPDDEAPRLVRWLQDRGFVGDIGWNALPGDERHAGILDYYKDYCIEERTTPLRPITLARALGRMSATRAIVKRQVDIGGRTLTVYWIPDSIDCHWINNEGDRDADRPPH